MTGEYITRCGLHGYPDSNANRPPNVDRAFAGEQRFFTANAEVTVTCPSCRLKVTAAEKKAMRVMLDYGQKGCTFKPASRFDFSVGRGLTVYGPGIASSLGTKGLVKDGMLTTKGFLLARTYPPVVDEFDRKRNRR